MMQTPTQKVDHATFEIAVEMAHCWLISDVMNWLLWLQESLSAG